MDAWLSASPYRAVGIYISGASRGCRDQPNLTPTWISTQLMNGWRLLPITLGPQASCNPSFPRYGNDPVISTKVNPAGAYRKAFKQGTAEASTTVAAAQALGIVPGSTLWYDLEGYDVTNGPCRESSLWFLSAWTQQMHALGYVSGVYSSAGSGIKSLDDARVLRPGVFTLPDQIWIARWDGQANTSTTYIRSDGWMPGRRVKQFQGGHDEKWGGVTINIDRNYLDLSSGTAPPPARRATATAPRSTWPTTRGSRRRPGARRRTRPGDRAQVPAQGAGRLPRPGQGRLEPPADQVGQAWQRQVGLGRTAMFSRSAWMTLLSAGPTTVLNLGSTGEDVRRVQRALNAASAKNKLPISGTPTPSPRRPDRLAGQERHRGERRGRPGFLGGPAGGEPLEEIVWPLRGIAAPAGKRRYAGRCGRGSAARRQARALMRTSAAASEVKKPRPSVPAPVSASTACSGCGIRPTTLPRSLVMPAMSRIEPLGLSSR